MYNAEGGLMTGLQFNRVWDDFIRGQASKSIMALKNIVAVPQYPET